MKPEEIHPKIQRLIRYKPNSFIFHGCSPGLAAAILAAKAKEDPCA